MIECLKTSTTKQALLLLITVLASGVFAWYFDYFPRLRFSLEMTVRGVLGGGLVVFAYSLLLLITTVFFAKGALAAQLQSQLPGPNSPSKQNSFLTYIGAGLTTGSGEELFFRGFLFSYLALSSVLWGYLANFVLGFLLYLPSRAGWRLALIRAIECSYYALMFRYNSSIYVVALAHGLATTITLLITDRQLLDPIAKHLRLWMDTHGLRRLRA